MCQHLLHDEEGGRYEHGPGAAQDLVGLMHGLLPEAQAALAGRACALPRLRPHAHQQLDQLRPYHRHRRQILRSRPRPAWQLMTLGLYPPHRHGQMHRPLLIRTRIPVCSHARSISARKPAVLGRPCMVRFCSVASRPSIKGCRRGANLQTPLPAMVDGE